MDKIKNKVRFTSLDTAAVINDLQFLIGLRVTNIYDINPTTYVLKLAKSQEKHYLLIENGVRFHTTPQKTDQKKIPSGFTMKFRKYLRSKRLQSIRQVGVERVVVLSFGTQAFANHLILQLYAQGNIILTDNNFKIIQCIRSHEFKQGVKTAVGSVYPFQYAAHIYMQTLKTDQQFVTQTITQLQEARKNQDQQNNDKKKKKKQGQDKLKDIVFKIIPCLFPLVIEHILSSMQINPDQKVSLQKMELIMQAVEGCMKFLNDFLKNKQKGFIFYKQKEKQKIDKNKKPLQSNQNNEKMIEQEQQKQKQIQKAYFEYSPFLNKKYVAEKNGYPYLEFSSFNQSVQQYYQYLNKNPTAANPQAEGQQFEEIAWKKYDQIKKDQQERMQKLKQEQQLCQLKAECIEKNIEDVDVIIKIVKTMEDNGCNWQTIQSNIWESKHNGNPFANMIHAVDMAKRQVTVLLGDPHDEQQLFELTPVQINIDYNAFTNATIYYESKKKTGQKEKRTKQASEQVLKLAEKDALKKIQKKKNELMGKNIPLRKSFWFEKFYWFMSSQGFLVISGRDSHQNQLLVKRYMKSGDLYMHSDYGGAASTVIKNPNKDDIVPRNTLEQAAIFTVCRSKAWQTKIISGAWWVHSQQVSKSAPTGQYLPTGSFMIRGKRNFLYPNRMEMGFTLLYKLDQQSMQKHANQQKERQIVQDQQLKKIQEVKIQQAGSQQFAIISLQTQPTGKKNQQQQQKGKGKNNQNNNEGLQLKKKSSQLPQQKQQQVQQVKDSDQQSGSDSSSQSHDQFQFVSKNKQKKVQQQQQQKGQKSKGQTSQQNQQPKQKTRNKKKLKKLQKYLEQQDDQQRQIIMKMIGARQMKHMKNQEDLNQQEQANKGKNKKNKKQKKKGLSKYMKQSDEEQINKPDHDKILFLKEKQKIDDEKRNQFMNKKKDQQQGKNQTQKRKQNKKTNQKTEKKEQKKEIKSQKVQQKQRKQQTITTEQTKSEIIEKYQKQKSEIQKPQIQKPEIQKVDGQQKKQSEKQGTQQVEDSSSEGEEGQQQNQEKNQQQKKEEKVQQQIDQKTLDSELAQLLKLVGKVSHSDKYEHLVPMCAPYPTIAENRFKIKLVPGGLKKGKAARNIVHYLLQTTDLTEQQKPLLRGVPEQQIINALIGNVKLAGAGLLKLQMKEKAEKKEKRKQTEKKKA